MFGRSFVFSIIVSTVFGLPTNDSTCSTPVDNSIYKVPGNVIITSFFGVHYGDNCTYVDSQAIQSVAAVIKAFEIVRRKIAIPGLKLGLSVYDTCSTEEFAQKALVESIVEAECSGSVILGGLVEKSTFEKMKELSQHLTYPLNILTSVSVKMLARIAARVLHQLNWAPVHYVVTESNLLANELIMAATDLQICVFHTLPLEEMYKIGPGGGTIVMMGAFASLKNASQELKESRVLFIPTDDGLESLPDLTTSKVLVVLPSQTEEPQLSNPFNVSENWAIANPWSDLLNTQTTNRQLLAVNDLLEMINSLKYYLQIHCSQQTICPSLPKILKRSVLVRDHETSESDLTKAMSFFELPKMNSSVVLELTSSGGYKTHGSVQFVDNRWIYRAESNVSDVTVFCKVTPTNDTVGLDCSKCYNFDSLYGDYFARQAELESSKPVLTLRDDAWVAAFLSISTVGVLCSLAIFVFIIVRICKKDMLEGNPGFSFLMLIAVIFMYCSIMPFSLRVIDPNSSWNGIFCGFKVMGTSLSYALVYSVMLARSLMLASCDEDGGFMSHVNGYLQTVLCFFMVAVQIALTVQFWAMNWVFFDKEQCAQFSQGRWFLYLMSYDMFLLVVLMCVSPFIMRSKRNYHEGGYFTVATVLCVLVWIGWSAGYILFPRSSELFVCLGLIATGSVVLITVFIPRTYLMLTGIVRDHLVSTLPSLVHTTSASVVDVNYRSNQALYDSVQIRGQVNPNYYAEGPPTPSTSKMEDTDVVNVYERYDRSPSPLTVTRF